MEHLNYRHLLYLWKVAREGTVARAAEQLGLSPSTLSSQIHRLERSLGEKLFLHRGRRLELTEAGLVAFRYASEIFSLGQEFREALKGQTAGRPVRLVVGTLDALSKPMVRRILDPVFVGKQNLRVTCREDRSLDGFLAELATFSMDLVLSDTPASPGLAVRLFNHLLGESGTTFFAAPALARRLRRGFPLTLDGAAVLLPGRKSASHRPIEQWFAAQDLHPRVVGEIDDSALMKLLGEAGRGVFAAPSVDERDIRRRYRVEIVGRTSAIRQRLYAITGERRIRHPGVIAITQRAQREIYG